MSFKIIFNETFKIYKNTHSPFHNGNQVRLSQQAETVLNSRLKGFIADLHEGMS